MTTTTSKQLQSETPVDRRERIELLTEELHEALTEFQAEKSQVQASAPQEPVSRQG
ncbi:hypothetical protein [Chitinimonas naiadis]